MRGRMTKADSYVQPFEIGKPIVSHVVAKVIDSTLADYKKGDVVVGMLPWRIINHVQAVSNHAKFQRQMYHLIYI